MYYLNKQNIIKNDCIENSSLIELSAREPYRPIYDAQATNRINFSLKIIYIFRKIEQNMYKRLNNKLIIFFLTN